MRRAFSLCFLLWCSAVSAAVVDYQATVDALNHSLDQTRSLYQQDRIQDAKSSVQSAYFDLFESLEGPVSINYSQQKSYELERQFSEIRRLIGAGAAFTDVSERIAKLQSELLVLPSVLEEGHQIVAEGNLVEGEVAAQWTRAFITIEDSLATALTLYQESDIQGAVDAVYHAQFEGFKNTELEIALRQQRSAAQAALYNQTFTQIRMLIHEKQNIQLLAYEISMLTDDLAEQVVGLTPTQVALDPVTESVALEAEESDWQQVSDQIASAIQQAIAVYQQGQVTQAIAQIQDIYFDQFEASGFESKIGALDINLKLQIEGRFTRLVSLMKSQATLEVLDAHFSGLQKELAQAVQRAQPQWQGFWMLLLASLTIIFREGLEALLIVTAITAFLIKSGHKKQLPLIRHAVLCALGASVITAYLFQLIFENSGASRELLEGVTMLIAAGVMFSMSYWLLAKVEAQRWKNYIENAVSSSLSKGSAMGLWLAGFLAVYREGAETILFYSALTQNADESSLLAVLAGFGLGIMILGIIYSLMRYSMLKIPLKMFFMVTGIFIYLMAFIFAGKGMLELMEAQVFEPTLLVHMPEISLLGIYPYFETLVPQGILFVAALVAFKVLRRPQMAAVSAI